jgi:hypothetical protein
LVVLSALAYACTYLFVISALVAIDNSLPTAPAYAPDSFAGKNHESWPPVSRAVSLSLVGPRGASKSSAREKLPVHHR